MDEPMDKAPKLKTVSAPSGFPQYRDLLDRARAALEEDGRMRGESPLLDDIYSMLGK